MSPAQHGLAASPSWAEGAQGACDLIGALFHAPSKSADLWSIVRELATVSACCFSLKVSLSMKKDGECHLFGDSPPPPRAQEQPVPP